MKRNNNKMIVQFFKVFGLLSLLLSLSACRQNSKHKVDEFYAEKGEWDSARIPFIKPYEAMIVDQEHGWVMNLKSLDAVANIKKATVGDGFILAHTGITLMMGAEIKESWWVVSPSRKIEKGFSDYEQYVAYIKTLGFKKVPRLHDIKVIASYYEYHDTMDWNALD